MNLDETNIPMTRAERLILDKLISLENEIHKLREEQAFESINDISLWRAAKLLHKHPDYVVDLVKCGKLKARRYKDADNKIRYRFTLGDIKKYQSNHTTVTRDESGYRDSKEILQEVNEKFEYQRKIKNRT